MDVAVADLGAATLIVDGAAAVGRCWLDRDEEIANV